MSELNDILPDEQEEMSFLDHLEELRWRVIKSIIGIVIAGIVVAVFIDPIINYILFAPAAKTNPPMTIINLKPFGQFTLYMQVILIGGILFSLPNIIYQFWKFIEPALKPNERKYITAIVIFTTICFLTGVVFAYLVMLPTALEFFAGFGSELIENNIAVDEYLWFIISMCLAAGLVFELPMISFFLAKLGILSPLFMRKYRKHAIVIIFILAAILTPSPDVTSQVLLGLPLILLYEISIFICKAAYKESNAETANIH